MPREENAEGGRMQLMLYKEMFDGMLRAGFEDLMALEGGDGGADGHEVEGKAKMKQTTLPMASLPAMPTRSRVSRDRPLDEFTFPALFTHLQLDPDAPFSSGFVDDSDDVIRGNDLKYGAAQAKTLNDMRMVWARYCSRLGVGLPPQRGDVVAKEDEERGKSDKRLALVYRHTEKRKKRRKRRKRESLTGEQRSDQTSEVLQDSAMDEDVAVALAIEASLAEAKSHLRAGQSDCDPVAVQEQDAEPTQDESQMDASQIDKSLLHPEPDREDLRPLLVDGEDQPLEPALFPPELLGRSDVALTTATDPGRRDKTPTPSSTTADHERLAAPGSLHSHDSSLPTDSSCDHRIIGTHSFIHSPRLLAARLDVSLGFWMGRTQPVGVDESEVSRCGWCEFEEGCEWR
jgi:exonuclease V